jgi:nitroreductase / dihydropteridine reductase
MDFKDVVTKRYAAKAFTGDKVPAEKIDELIDLIRVAPSALNLQPWRIRVVSDQKTREELGPAMFGQPHGINCSHLLILCANTDIDEVIRKADQSMRDAGFPDEGRSRIIEIATNMKANFGLAWAQQQVFLALANAVNGAKALGLDSCPMTGFDPGRVAQVLGLPSHLVPTAICPVGYGADSPMPKARLSRADLLV